MQQDKRRKQPSEALPEDLEEFFEALARLLVAAYDRREEVRRRGGATDDDERLDDKRSLPAKPSD